MENELKAESFVDDVEIRKIIDNGPPSNRIDVVFMGDGYTLNEKEKFLSDIERLVDEMWASSTFVSVLPLFNVWAVFTASEEHGIGVGGVPKNTTFGLYREGTVLRAILPTHEDRLRSVCKLAGRFACDFSAVIGNDEYYGGLGGEFIISTRSKTSGTIVLRHEMGHNFINVGEEYDGGQVYSGVNSGDRVDQLPWMHWLTEPGKVREERLRLAAQDYAWFDLSQGPYNVSFTSDGTYASWLLKLSASGVESPDSFQVFLDGRKMEWSTVGHLDRAFYEWRGDSGFTNGAHILQFKQGFPSTTGRIRQLCSLDLHEYGSPSEFHEDNRFISAFPTFDLEGRKTYRPTNEGCIMRNMSSHSFCNVCIEGLWTNLLNRISLVDGLTQSCTQDGTFNVSLSLLPMTQSRDHGTKSLVKQIPEYQIRWMYKGQVVSEWDDYTTILIPKEQQRKGEWEARVVLKTGYVRKDEGGVLKWAEYLDVRKCHVFS